MNELKVCFIGIGSIAKRHIKNLRMVCGTKGLKLTIDAFRRRPELIEGIDHVYTSKTELPCDYDAIFITNPTEYHLETLEEFNNNSKHFFIEKPVVSISQIDKAANFNLKKNSIYYVAAPLRYNAVIQWFKKKCDDVNTRQATIVVTGGDSNEVWSYSFGEEIK